MRQLLAAAAAAAVAALGAFIVGEYELDGPTALVTGVLFGLVIGEILVAVAGGGQGVVAVAGAVIAGAGLVGAAWISSGATPEAREWSDVPGAAWAGAALGAAAAAAWVRGFRRRGVGSSSSP